MGCHTSKKAKQSGNPKEAEGPTIKQFDHNL